MGNSHFILTYKFSHIIICIRVISYILSYIWNFDLCITSDFQDALPVIKERVNQFSDFVNEEVAPELKKIYDAATEAHKNVFTDENGDSVTKITRGDRRRCHGSARPRGKHLPRECDLQSACS